MIKVAAISVAVLGVVAYVWFQSVRPAALEMYVFDTPGVPAVFIRTPNDKRILINGGSNSEVVRRVSKVLPFYSRRIDWVIASDTEGRTIAGLRGIIDRYHVNEILGLKDTRDLRAGDILLFDDDVTAEIIFPVDEKLFKYSKASPPQILLTISYGETSVIFAGQATDKILKFIGAAATTTVRVNQVLIHKTMVNGINIRKNGPVRVVSDGHTIKVGKI